ncbi:Protein of unknown function [Gryllus bimaculatus]|nr:Protein of unknown function [Gryllus bimaculatus]
MSSAGLKLHNFNTKKRTGQNNASRGRRRRNKTWIRRKEKRKKEEDEKEEGMEIKEEKEEAGNEEGKNDMWAGQVLEVGVAVSPLSRPKETGAIVAVSLIMLPATNRIAHASRRAASSLGVGAAPTRGRASCVNTAADAARRGRGASYQPSRKVPLARCPALPTGAAAAATAAGCAGERRQMPHRTIALLVSGGSRAYV